MKLSLAFVALTAATASAQDGRIRNCNFVKTFGSSDGGIEATGLQSFAVIDGAEVICYTGCFSGGTPTNVAYNFGSEPLSSSDVTSTATDSDDECKRIETTFTASGDQTSLGWAITAEANYDKLVLGCICTNDGTDFTIDSIEEKAQELKDRIDEYVQDIQDAIDNVSSTGCFSESATVQVYGKGAVAMKDLKLNDKVLTAKNTFETVYSFGHRKPETSFEFYQVKTGLSDSPLELTGNHMVMVLDSKGKAKATRADQLQVGDTLLHVESEEKVEITSVEKATKTGLYMPLTPSGTIVVNDLLASNYISISDTHPGVVEHSQMFFPMNEQTLSHWWMSPARMLCMGVSSTFCSDGTENYSSAYEVSEGDEGILPWLLMGRHFAHVAEHQPGFVRFMLGVPTFVLFGLFNTVEHAFLGPAYAPLLFTMAIISVMVALKKKMSSSSEFERSAGYGLLSNSIV